MRSLYSKFINKIDSAYFSTTIGELSMDLQITNCMRKGLLEKRVSNGDGYVRSG